MHELWKYAGELGQSMAIGAGGGAMVGALASMFREQPSLRKVLVDALAGATGGAALGGGINAAAGVGVFGSPSPAPSAATPPPAPGKKPTPGNLDLKSSALANLAPFGGAIHGGINAGAGQGLASGAAYVAPWMINQMKNSGPDGAMVKNSPRKALLLHALGALGSFGTSVVGNKLRDNAVEA